MANKLYVGSLDYGTTTDQLRELFAQAGSVVDATVITDRYSGRSKGFGFVEMSSDEEAKKAIEMFNGKDFQGRSMIVNEARPKRTDNFGSGAGSRRTFTPSAPVSAPTSQPVSAQASDSTAEPDEPASGKKPAKK